MELDQLTSIEPYLQQMTGIWAIHQPAGESLHSLIQGTDLHIHLNGPMAAAARSRAENPGTSRVNSDSIAIISMEGTLQKHWSSFGGTSTIAVRQAIRAAGRDESVKAIMLLIDSPGGTSAGTAELADDIAAARKSKPVWAYFQDIGASAAYWAGSQADKVFANAAGLVGSIGTYMVVQDLSAAAAMKGIKVHVVKAGDMKGTGVPGTEVTPDQLAELQTLVNSINDHFIAGVMRGRNMTEDRVRALADGRIHASSKAQELGLIDAVATFDEALAQLSLSLQRSKPKMSESTTERKAATLQELKAACDGAGSDFLMEQLERGSTLQEAQGAWVKQLKADKEAAVKQAEESQAAAKAADEAKVKAEADAKSAREKRGRGVEPVLNDGNGDGEPASGHPIDDWNRAKAELVAKGKTEQQAIRQLVQEQPDLHQSYVDAYTAQHGAACGINRRR